ncbi:hypothetical protein EFQ99_29540 [Rhizobium vallis]|uniref:Uncharacterized protein n=2 Tax=Rhizobium vallis TaxID=634290 RepID=A0A432PC65_9HYPH|nr:hypothetical protein EFQ99_29540 [Rhizobium vallis]
MDHHTAPRQFGAQFVQRHIAIAGNMRGNPLAMRPQFTTAWGMTCVAGATEPYNRCRIIILLTNRGETLPPSMAR